MKNKILKTITVLILLATLTMVNLVYVGVGLVSYAADNVATNNQNVEFDAQIKDNNNILYLEVNVKKEGYFNGTITLENSNFKLKNSNSEYINKIENNVITLNQINAGTTAKMEIVIEPIHEEIFNVGLLNITSKLNLAGTYKDSTEKNINIKATKEVKLEYAEENTSDNVNGAVEVITNKIVKVSGEEKRVVQISTNLGLKNNNYPIKEIKASIPVPVINKKSPNVAVNVTFNTMTHYSYEYDGQNINIAFTNVANDQNNILWRNAGSENVVITLIYDKDTKVEKTSIPVSETITLYNEKQLEAYNEAVISDEEKDALVQIKTTNTEDSIYKGKLNSNIERQIETKTAISVNLANVEDSIIVKENNAKYLVSGEEMLANVVYNKTTINKEKFDKIFGQNGIITITNENDEVLETITNSTPVDEKGNIVVSYEQKEPAQLKIQTTTPIKEGTLELTHTKTIKNGKEASKNTVTALATKIEYEYGTGAKNTVTSQIQLQESTKETTLKLNKETLSTVVKNNIEMRATLKTNSEQYNLYTNPTLEIDLPEEVENIEVKSIDLIYEDELKVKDYNVDGRKIIVNLEGTQTQYKQASIEGSVVVINADLTVNKKVATAQKEIVMNCLENNQTVATSKSDIKIVAPKDVTLINSIKDLSVETIGQEEVKKVTIQRGTTAKQLETQLEIINNNENAIENVKVIGTFPTNNNNSNMNIKVVEGINLVGAKVYYTENENATDDIQNASNAWTQTISNPSKVKKYLIIVASIDKQASIQATYKIEIPEMLEYNQIATQGYSAKYTNTLTKNEDEVKATTIQLETGIGPKVEIKAMQTVGGNEITSNDTVRNGEVIKYKIQVSNTGSEKLKDIQVQGNVPEGTTLVEPEEHFEYTGTVYYKELEGKTYTSTIKELEVGQVITKEYEVRVNSKTQAGTKLANKTSVKYGDVTKNSEELQTTTQEGKIRVTVKRVTDRDIDLYEAGSVEYFAIIENISDKKQDNVKVKTNLPNTLKVSNLTLITGMGPEEVTQDDVKEESGSQTSGEIVDVTGQTNIKSEKLEYSDELNIGSLEVGEAKVLSYDMAINKVEDTNQVQFSVVAINGNEQYKSNTIADNIKQAKIELSMLSNTQTNYLQSGDVVEYTITIKNTGTADIEGVKVKDTIPSSLSVNKVSFDDEEIANLKGRNNLEISCDISANTQSTIKIETVVNYSEGRVQAEPITNIAYAELLGEKIATTSQINHIIKANQTSNPDNNNGNDNNNNGNGNEEGDVANGKSVITGLAWFDENADGKKDDNEKVLSNIKVQLLNTQTNNLVKDEKGKTIEATTNDSGVYVLNNIKDGKYIAIFEYDTTKYSLTKYKVNNIEEAKNSDVMLNELQIGEGKQKVASTDILQISNDNISDINIGLTKLENFDLKLEKFVSKIVIQDASGTTIKEYSDETLAKAELDAKKVNGATVIIEYKIKVTNAGEVPGYAKKIADYMPQDLKFSSELNKDWYQTGEVLYNSSLSNEKIESGATKEITLTLTKAMTQNNTGRTNNTAEIAESYNELGLADSNSTPGNKVQGENDMGSADVILSIRTGGIVYISIAVVVLVALGITAFIIIRKKSNNDDLKI